MGTTLNRHAYQRVIDEDLEWLNNQPRSLEREHIAEIVRLSPSREYDVFDKLERIRYCKCKDLGSEECYGVCERCAISLNEAIEILRPTLAGRAPRSMKGR